MLQCVTITAPCPCSVKMFWGMIELAYYNNNFWAAYMMWMCWMTLTGCLWVTLT
jgi:hypothetical protein